MWLLFVPQVTTSSISSLARLPWGSKVATSSGENIDLAIGTPTLQLYEFGKTINSVTYGWRLVLLVSAMY